jgi:HK97 gp10 family phage protein
MAKLKGADKVQAMLKALNSPSARRRVRAAVYVAADMIRVEAALSISQGAVSGKNHKVSKPGEAPNFDTGFLAGAIETRETGGFEAEVRSMAPYSAELEFGTSRMAERPFMRPATAKVRPKAERLIAAALGNERGRK